MPEYEEIGGWDELFDENTEDQNENNENDDDLENQENDDVNGDDANNDNNGDENNEENHEENEDENDSNGENNEGDDENGDDNNGDENNEGGDDNNDSELSGIEMYLSNFDIEGGMIQFDDGTSTHFNDLNPDKQAEILNELHGAQATSIEEKYGLDETEVGLINYLRSNEMTVEQLVENMAQERVSTLMASQQAGSTNFEEMEADAVYLHFLQRSNPEADPEQLEADLEKAKTMGNYENVVKSLRTQFKSEQELEVQRASAAEAERFQEQLEAERKQVVEAITPLKDIAGVELNDGIKNGILEQVLEVNDQGDSKFMEEVFGDPTTLFKAAFWYYYGEDLMNQRDDYWKKEKSAAYKRGRSEALGTDDNSSKRTFSSKGNKNTRNKQTTPNKNKGGEQVEDWHTLFD